MLLNYTRIDFGDHTVTEWAILSLIIGVAIMLLSKAWKKWGKTNGVKELEKHWKK